MGETTEHVGMSLIPQEAQEWQVPTEAPHDRLDLRGALVEISSYLGALSCLGTAWTICPQEASGLARISSTLPLSPHSTPSIDGEGVVAFPVIVPSLVIPGQC